MINLADVASRRCDWRISLTKLLGKSVADIEGYLTTELGGVTFKVSEIIFDDDTSMGVEGEHDCPYLCKYPSQPQRNFDYETLQDLLEQGGAE